MLHEYLQYFHQKTYYNHCFYEFYSIVRIFISKKIGVREYSNIEIPTISVSTTYTGASAIIIETKITEQVENSIAGIEGLVNIKSTSKDGLSNVKLVFSIDRNLDNAVNDVRYRVSRIYNRLPYDANLPVIFQWHEWKFPTIWTDIY